jgi:ribosomal protein S18 acetylase RimI-like enzyme
MDSEPLQLLERTSAFYMAMEANIAEEVNCFGRGLPDGEVHENAELTWFYTGRPYLNVVTRTHLTSDDEAYAHQKITEMIDYYKKRHQDFAWQVNPHTNPTNMGTLLEARGFTAVVYHTWMALDIRRMNELFPLLPNLVITEVMDARALSVFRDVAQRGFETPESQTQTYYDNYLANGFGPGNAWHHFIGYLDGEPVADSSLLLYAGIAGIYGVATLAEVRRLGIATQMTLHALREARKSGYRVAVLVPSNMGINIYRRIGFAEYSQSIIYNLSHKE